MKTYENRIFRLVEPSQFTETYEDISEIPEGDMLVKPTYGSICQADVRYFTGKRRKEDLEKKLPMALIHEGVGEIEKTANGYTKSDSVVLVPNIPGYIHSPDKFGRPCDICLEVGENYCPEAHFCSSGFDGFAGRYKVHPEKCVLKLPDSVPEETGVYCELFSVINNMYKRLPEKKTKIAVFGDGPMSYLTSLYLSQKEISREGELWVVGINDSKLENFDSYNTVRFDDNNLEEYLKNTDVVVECVGGRASGGVINKGIKLLKPGGTLALVGVSEEQVPIDTRNILAKGLRLYGTSRSEIDDFNSVLGMLESTEIQQGLNRLTHKTFKISSLKDMHSAFNYASEENYWGKILLKFDM